MFPETSAASAALAVATRYLSPALLNHSVRAYLWGTRYAAAHGITFDDELYYVSALLHDVALTREFDNHHLAFEDAGGHLAWLFGVAAGWPADRAARAEEIVVLHMRADVAAEADPESHLLQVATAWDVAGRHAGEFSPQTRAEVLAHYPRLDFGKQFLACFQDQAARKPGTSAEQAVANGVAERIAAHPLG